MCAFVCKYTISRAHARNSSTIEYRTNVSTVKLCLGGRTINVIITCDDNPTVVGDRCATVAVLSARRAGSTRARRRIKLSGGGAPRNRLCVRRSVPLTRRLAQTQQHAPCTTTKSSGSPCRSNGARETHPTARVPPVGRQRAVNTKWVKHFVRYGGENF